MRQVHHLAMAFFGILLGLASAITPAQAQATRTWVSGVGDDANPCSRTAPCKTFAGAISKTAAGGEINCIDPGGFGGVTITKAMTIDCANTEAGVLVSGTNGITVSAGANDVVVLRGLDIIGTTSVPALNGIVFNSGSALHVEKCRIREFLSAAPNGVGILFKPNATAELYVANSSITNNGAGATGGGIFIQPTGSSTVRGTVVNTLVENNTNGIFADGSGTTGRSDVSIQNTTVAGNSLIGVVVLTPASGGGTTTSMVVNSQIVNNNTGINSIGTKSSILIGSTTVTGNTTGLAFSGGGALLSYKNNNVNANLTTDGAPSGPLTQQ